MKTKKELVEELIKTRKKIMKLEEKRTKEYYNKISLNEHNKKELEDFLFEERLELSDLEENGKN